MNEDKTITAKPINVNRVGLRESVVNHHYATVEENTTRDDVLNPSFWANYAKFMKPFDHVTVLYHYDRVWVCDYLVLDVGKQHAKLVERSGSFQEIDDGALGTGMEIEGFYIKWGNLHTGHRIHRKEDKSVIKEGFSTRDEAYRWLVENIANLKRDAA